MTSVPPLPTESRSDVITQRLAEVLYLHHPHAVCISDMTTGTIVDVNRSFEAMFGFSRAEAKTLAISRITDPGDWQFADFNTQKQVPREGVSHQMEKKCHRKDGSSFWGDLTTTLLFDEQQHIDCAITVIIDVTDIKKIQNAIEERDTFIRALYNNAAQAISSTDENGRFIEVNPAFISMFGYSRREALCLTHLDITAPAFRHSSREKAEALFRKEIQAYRMEKMYLRKDGSMFWGDLSITAIHKPDGKVQSVAVIVDISDRKRAEVALQQNHDDLENRVNQRTMELAESNRKLKNEIANRARIQDALKESEERLRTLFEATTVNVFIKDRNLRYTMVNPCMASLFEMSPSQLIGLTDEDLFDEEESHHLRQVDNRVLTGETIEELHTRTVKGSLITFSDNRTPMRDHAGNIIGICGISRDITERRNRQIILDDAGYDYPSKAMQATLLQARTVARTDAIVLLTGESGAGKDHMARYIHMQSRHSAGPYYSINCGAIPPDLAESELFGHERGAFTGATRSKRGLLELAEGGTVLLNEIGELPLQLQVKLLTFLDTFTFTRVGGEKKIAVNARILAATNRDLQEEVSAGRFREDLFYRLNIVPIAIPPLRRRRADIPIIVGEILDNLIRELQLPYQPFIDDRSMERLTQYPWPGNIRETKNAIERAIILSKGPRLTFDFLTPDMTCDPAVGWSTVFPPPSSLNATVTDLTRYFIDQALRQSNGVKTKAARMLGISRYTLMRHLQKPSQNVALSHTHSENKG
jgi:sigma-54 dependent transcriptional regulator, acetoin dehydrogenase operon transcriptional activator AcoR